MIRIIRSESYDQNHMIRIIRSESYDQNHTIRIIRSESYDQNHRQVPPSGAVPVVRSTYCLITCEFAFHEWFPHSMKWACSAGSSGWKRPVTIVTPAGATPVTQAHKANLALTFSPIMPPLLLHPLLVKHKLVAMLAPEQTNSHPLTKIQRSGARAGTQPRHHNYGLTTRWGACTLRTYSIYHHLQQ